MFARRSPRFAWRIADQLKIKERYSLNPECFPQTQSPQKITYFTLLPLTITTSATIKFGTQLSQARVA